MPLPSVIEQVVQIVGATAADWTSTTQPLPNNVLVIAMDTGDVKRGNGVALYSDLPVLFNVNDIVEFMTLLAGKAPLVHTHSSSSITDLASLLTGKSDTGHTHTVAQLPEVATALNDRPTTTSLNAALALKADKADIAFAPAAVVSSFNYSGVI